MDTITPDRRSANMGAIRSKGMKPEMALRRLVHKMGFRYLLHGNLPGRPDLMFPRRRKVIFVHGCFWHQHMGCKISRIPKSNLDYWLPKLERNKSRDETNLAELNRLGWMALVVWECQLQNEPSIIQEVKHFLG